MIRSTMSPEYAAISSTSLQVNPFHVSVECVMFEATAEWLANLDPVEQLSLQFVVLLRRHGLKLLVRYWLL